MYDTDGNKHHTCIRDNLFNCRLPHQRIHLKGKGASVTVYQFKNAFCEKKLPLIENLGIKSLSSFKH